MTQIAEIVTFTLAPDVTSDAFVALSQASEAFVRAAPGFVARQLSRGEDGRWTDYVIWRDLAAAQAVARQFAQQDFAPALIAAIAPGSLSLRHERVEWAMPA